MHLCRSFLETHTVFLSALVRWSGAKVWGLGSVSGYSFLCQSCPMDQPLSIIHSLVGGTGLVSRLGAVLQNAPVDICVNVGVDVFICLGKMSRGKIVGLPGYLHLTFLGSKLVPCHFTVRQCCRALASLLLVNSFSFLAVPTGAQCCHIVAYCVSTDSEFLPVPSPGD